MPCSVNFSYPGWKDFSIKMPTPAMVACALRIRRIAPVAASPFAKKSSIINTWSFSEIKFLERVSSYRKLQQSGKDPDLRF